MNPASIPDPVEMTASALRPGDRIDAEQFVNLDNFPEAEFELFTIEQVTEAPVIGVTLHLVDGPALHFDFGDLVPAVRREHFPDAADWIKEEQAQKEDGQ